MLLSNSKIYKYSKNKAAIKAAVQNPINSELVMQLSEQLSDDTIEELLGIRVEDTKEPAEDDVEHVFYYFLRLLQRDIHPYFL